MELLRGSNMLLLINFLFLEKTMKPPLLTSGIVFIYLDKILLPGFIAAIFFRFSGNSLSL